LSSLADFTTEIHFGHERSEHTNEPHANAFVPSASGREPRTPNPEPRTLMLIGKGGCVYSHAKILQFIHV